MAPYDSVGKHLELIQAIVSRMAGNSFLLKGWSVTIAAALFALATKDSDPRFAWIALLPSVAFWGLDAYYLRHERLFRCLYNAVRTSASDYDPFSLDVSQFRSTVRGWFGSLISPSVAGIHGTVVVAIILVLFIMR